MKKIENLNTIINLITYIMHKNDIFTNRIKELLSNKKNSRQVLAEKQSLLREISFDSRPRPPYLMDLILKKLYEDIAQNGNKYKKILSASKKAKQYLLTNNLLLEKKSPGATKRCADLMRDLFVMCKQEYHFSKYTEETLQKYSKVRLRDKIKNRGKTSVRYASLNSDIFDSNSDKILMHAAEGCLTEAEKILLGKYIVAKPITTVAKKTRINVGMQREVRTGFDYYIKFSLFCIEEISRKKISLHTEYHRLQNTFFEVLTPVSKGENRKLSTAFFNKQHLLMQKSEALFSTTSYNRMNKILEQCIAKLKTSESNNQFIASALSYSNYLFHDTVPFSFIIIISSSSFLHMLC